MFVVDYSIIYILRSHSVLSPYCIVTCNRLVSFFGTLYSVQSKTKQIDPQWALWTRWIVDNLTHQRSTGFNTKTLHTKKRNNPLRISNTEYKCGPQGVQYAYSPRLNMHAYDERGGITTHVSIGLFYAVGLTSSIHIYYNNTHTYWGDCTCASSIHTDTTTLTIDPRRCGTGGGLT